MSSARGAFLDVQPSLLTDRLLIADGASSADDPRSLASLTMPAEAAANERRSDSMEITPRPAVCCKTRTSEGGKVFVNVCTSGDIPPPQALTEEELREILQDDTRAPQFRVPMSIGEAHKEVDKLGGACVAYDVVIHPDFYVQVDGSLLFKTFLVTVMIEALEEKFGVVLDKNQWVTLRNKLYLGKMPKHYIRRRDVPMVQECSRADATAARAPTPRPLISEVATRRTTDSAAVSAPHQIQFREDGRIVVTFELPAAVTSARQVSVEVGEDRLVVAAEEARVLADVFLPGRVDPDSARSAFSLASRRLAVTVAQVV